ncbi:S8 family peptidase [Ramlibacter sp. MAHUQ-53]|uniref:S8 family peptidase n=1 Tax=unclassified Ramlibacter TaxID=2617605 RepID=UPI00363909A4
MKAFIRTFGIALLATAAWQALPVAAQTRSAVNAPYGVSRPVADRYIVVFKSHVANPAAQGAQMAQSHGGRLHHAYGHALKGFSATLPAAAVNALRNHPDVASIEQDQTVSLQQSVTQSSATWGLDRIDQVDLPLNTQYTYSQTGAGVTAFVVDTGIRADHSEFAGRLLPGFTAVADGQGTNDCNGHGTHVAGTVAGTTWGVAKGAKVVPVRVLDCSGNGAWSQVIAGLDYVASSTARPAVANLSLGGSASSTLDAAVAGAVSKGVTVVVAAGNSNVDACTASPAREPSAITVGATMSSDYRAYFSNIGTCLDLFAPGYNIVSAGIAGTTASATMSGTSMAAPHVAGAAALILQANPGATPATVASTIKANATTNHVIAAGTGSPNLLLSIGSASAPVTQPAPVVTQTVAVRSLGGSGARTGGSSWKASATINVRDVATGAAVANATVSGSFAPGGTFSCKTGSTGACTVSTGNLKSSTTRSTTFTVGDISGTQLQYDGAQNVATQVVILAP